MFNMVFSEMQEQGLNVCSFFGDYYMLLSVSRLRGVKW